MPEQVYPKDYQIRAALLRRAAQFTGITGASAAAIGRHAVNDPGFVPRIARGQNFTVSTYQRVMDWLDTHWPDSRNSSSAATP